MLTVVQDLVAGPHLASYDFNPDDEGNGHQDAADGHDRQSSLQVRASLPPRGVSVKKKETNSHILEGFRN